MAAQFSPGDEVERYRIEAVLGDGGTARVYRVRHLTLGTVHALKVLTMHHPAIQARLIEEGKAQARLQHPNLVPVRDVLQIGESEALLMDFVPGRTLRKWIEEQPLDLGEVLHLFRGVVSGVGYAHSHGLIHRDIKPANVLLDEREQPPIARVADFGLVRLLDLPGESTRHTRAGTTMGTLGYMAPEQLRDARAADARTDVFALGALLYAMLTGRTPFQGADQVDLIQATTEGRFTPLSDVMREPIPSGWEAVVERCLQVDPEDRFADTDALLTALDSLSVGSTPEKASLESSTQVGMLEESPTEQTVSVQMSPVAEESAVEEPFSASVNGLMVDQAGQGHAVTVRVRLDPNDSGVMHPPGIARDAQVSAQLAVAVALGAEAEEFGVRWVVEGITEEIRGTSLGLPLAVALWAARHAQSPPAGWAYTGGVDLDGKIAPVSGVPAKLRAAAAAGVERVGVPVEGLGALNVPAGLQVVPCRRWAGTQAQLFPQSTATKKPRNLRWLALLIPALMALTSLTAAVEPLLHDPLLRWVHGALPADNTVILAFPPQRDARALRADHPGVIDTLVAQGARTIFFDVTMTAETEHDDEIARAIRDAEGAGVPVILPVMLEDDLVLFPASESLRDAGRFGAVLAQADTALWHVRRAPARVRTLSDGDHWHAAVLSVQAHLAVREDPVIKEGELLVGPNRNPVWADLVYLHPAEPTPVMKYGEPDSWTNVAGRTVLIGEMGGSDDLHRTDADTVYGVEIEAALIETLLQQRAPRLVAPEYSALFALLTGWLTAMVMGAMPRSRRLLAAVVPAAAVAISVVLVVAGALIAMIPMLIGAVIGGWIARGVVTPGGRHP